MNRSIRVAPERVPDCRGSGAEFEAVNPHLPYGEVQCSCGRRFRVRLRRTRRGVALLPPLVIVPRHREEA